MASSAAQNIPASAHIQALHHKTHHKPAADKPAPDERFADLLAETGDTQPQKPAQPKEKTARADKPAAPGAKSETAAEIKEEPAAEETADTAASETRTGAEIPADEKPHAANDNETAEGMVPQALAPEIQAKLKETAQPAPEAAKTGAAEDAITPAHPAAGDAAEAEQATPDADAAAPEFETALHEAKAEAPRAPEAAQPKAPEMKPAGDIATVTLAGNAPAAQTAPGPDRIAAAHAPQTGTPQPPHPAPDLHQFAVEVAARTQSGAKQFDIRLDPPELGRVEVRLSIDAAGKAEAHLTADQPQTLDLLQKDASALARALRDAGLNLGQDALAFSLRNQQQQAGHDGPRHQGSRAVALPQHANETAEAAAPRRRSLGLLDIRV